jgi:hypothetical protein
LVTHAGFDLKDLYDALDERRRARNLTWAAVTREVNRCISPHPRSRISHLGSPFCWKVL